MLLYFPFHNESISSVRRVPFSPINMASPLNSKPVWLLQVYSSSKQPTFSTHVREWKMTQSSWIVIWQAFQMFVLLDTAIPQLGIYPKKMTRYVQKIYKNIYANVEN